MIDKKKLKRFQKKNQELADKIKIEARSHKVKKNEKSERENKKVEAKIIQTEVFEELGNADVENNLVQKKIDEKILLKELAEQRNKEIQKRKYSYFNNENISKDIEVDNTKYFFDEGIVDKLSQKNTSKQVVDEKLVKKKLQKKKEDYNNKNTQQPISENKIISAFNTKPVIPLEKKKLNEKTEIFIYESNQIDLDTTQKMKISEYVSLIKNKPIKIHIKSSVFEDDLKINKSRTLLVRAFLVKLGISHNRIKIDFEKEFNDINKDEIAISFIEI